MVTENRELLNAGSALAQPIKEHGGVPYVALPEEYAVHDLESLLPSPTRKRAKVTMLDSASFIKYVNKHGSLDACNLYANVDYSRSVCNIVAIVDDHGSDKDAAQWRDHTATFVPELSFEWKRWYQMDKQAKEQAEFAAFIEDNMGDIAGIAGMPSGADMLQMALSFEATSEKRFKKRIDLQTGGAQLEYVDKADEATSTKLRLFERFTIAVPVFQNSNVAYPLEARLKFRQKSGTDSLVFWFELIRPDRVFKEAVTEEINSIQAQTGMPLFYGNAGL